MTAEATDRVGDVMDALKLYDAAMREHLRDCWLGADSEAAANARYAAMKEAKDALDRATSRYVARHAVEFEAQQEERAALAATEGGDEQ